MGAGQSKTDQDEEEILIETPVQFSQDVVNHLADAAATPDPSPERQSSIDAQIRSHIHAELQKLQWAEEEVRREIQSSLEKENLDHGVKPMEQGHPDDDTTPEDGSLKTLNSNILLGDLEEVRQRVDKFRSKREDIEQYPAVQAADALSTCYANNASRPLDCWREVTAFKAYVAQLEQDYIASF